MANVFRAASGPRNHQGGTGRDAFRKAALDEMISPKELWAQLEPLARDLGMTTAQAKHLQAVLIGLDDYTADQLMELTRDMTSGPLPSQLLFKA